MAAILAIVYYLQEEDDDGDPEDNQAGLSFQEIFFTEALERM